MPTLQASDRLRMAPPLRKSGPCIPVSASLIVVLAIAVLVNLGLLAGMGPDVAGVFFRALALSTLLSCVPLSVLWFLDRREREAPLRPRNPGDHDHQLEPVVPRQRRNRRERQRLPALNVADD